MIASLLIALPLALSITIAEPSGGEFASDSCPTEIEDHTITAIQLNGLSQTHHEVVRRELLHTIGAAFSCTRWTREYGRLHNLDIFAAIDLQPRAKSNTVDLTYKFTELPSIVPYPSIKRTDQDGWLLGVGGTTLNLFGQAIRVDLAGRLGVEPFLNTKELVLFTSSRWLFDYAVGHEFWLQVIQTYNALKQFDERAVFSTIEFFPRFAAGFEGIIAGGILTVAHTDDAAQEFSGSGPLDVVPRLAIGLRRDTHADRGDPRSGLYTEARFTHHGGFLGGPVDFQEYLLDIRKTTRLAQRHVVLAGGLLRQRVGEVPFYELLHVGGPNTLRAYQPKPKRQGASELLAGVEYRWTAAERTRFSLFGIDAYTGVQFVVGADLALLWGTKIFQEVNRYSSLFVGMHLVVPGVQRVRFEFGMRENARVFGLTVGLFERSTIQRWRVR